METATFSLNNRDEVEKFEFLLYQYAATNAQFALKHISLTSAYDQLQSREDGGRVFTALLDVQINFILLYCDSHIVGATWNHYFSRGKLEDGSILDSRAKFFGKMDIHRYNTSYILRYRALWDKLMGLLVLVASPKDYDRFITASSKKRAFKKIARESDNIPKDFAAILEELLTNFDDKFRTPEAHGTGTLRKYSFTMESMAANPQIELVGYWNFLCGYVVKIGEMFGNKASA